jgi:hypothetical protein
MFSFIHINSKNINIKQTQESKSILIKDNRNIE